jgi:cytochrome b subunit of formate dehydrogenase
MLKIVIGIILIVYASIKGGRLTVDMLKYTDYSSGVPFQKPIYYFHKLIVIALAISGVVLIFLGFTE